MQEKHRDKMEKYEALLRARDAEIEKLKLKVENMIDRERRAVEELKDV